MAPAASRRRNGERGRGRGNEGLRQEMRRWRCERRGNDRQPCRRRTGNREAINLPGCPGAGCVPRELELPSRRPRCVSSLSYSSFPSPSYSSSLPSSLSLPSRGRKAIGLDDLAIETSSSLLPLPTIKKDGDARKGREIDLARQAPHIRCYVGHCHCI